MFEEKMNQSGFVWLMLVLFALACVLTPTPVLANGQGVAEEEVLAEEDAKDPAINETFPEDEAVVEQNVTIVMQEDSVQAASEEEARVGWVREGATTRYYDTWGTMAVGWEYIDGKLYYFDTDGAMAKGWRTIDGRRYYFQDDGSVKKGWLTIGNKRYHFTDDGVMQTGLATIGKKTYFFKKDGAMHKGWKTVEGRKYYFGKKGYALKGLKKIKGKRYYFMSDGVMANCGLYKKYIVGWNGVLHKIPTKRTGNKEADALRVAKAIAKCVPPKSKLKKQKDLTRVAWAAKYVAAFSNRCRYTMQGDNYYSAYGVFIAKEYSCAGSTRALGLVLDCLGYKWKHVNENMMKHQWVRLKMDRKTGYADGQVGWAGYGKHPVESQL